MTRTLPRLLSHLPANGVNSKVFQTRWAAKGLPTPVAASNSQQGCYWDVKKVDTKFGLDEKSRTKAMGVFYWKGKRITPENLPYEPIKGSLKYSWTVEKSLLPVSLNPEAGLKELAPVKEAEGEKSA
ncbi:hypothetical protein T439DRAFT_330177 [Meredithblackwellia eburnea MCA 4105]